MKTSYTEAWSCLFKGQLAIPNLHILEEHREIQAKALSLALCMLTDIVPKASPSNDVKAGKRNMQHSDKQTCAEITSGFENYCSSNLMLSFICRRLGEWLPIERRIEENFGHSFKAILSRSATVLHPLT